MNYETMNYEPIYPTDRNDQSAQLVTLAVTIFAYLFTFIQAPTASGKTRNMAALSDSWIEKNGAKSIIFSIAHNESVASQHKGEFELFGYSVLNFHDPSTGREWRPLDLFKKIKDGGKYVIVLYGISHLRGKPSRAASLFENMLLRSSNDGFSILVHIDELHLQLTQLTGGINSSFSTSRQQILRHRNVKSKKDINVFEWLRNYNATAIGWSATQNNLIASRTYSMGYHRSQMSLINIAPIDHLFSTREFEKFNTDLPEEYLMMMRVEEEMGGKILCVFSCVDDLNDFRLLYRKFNGKPISATEITYESSFDEERLARSLERHQYILGINMVATGFNLASYIGVNFSAIFLFRKFSDKGSAVLSRNKNHFLYSETSALFAQAAGRARDSECRIYTSCSTVGTNLLEIHRRFFELAEGACKEATRYGPPATSQVECEFVGIYVAICQNITSGSPSLNIILDMLFKMTGRCLEEEYDHEDCDHLFWREAIAGLWTLLDQLTPPDIGNIDKELLELSLGIIRKERDKEEEEIRKELLEYEELVREEEEEKAREEEEKAREEEEKAREEEEEKAREEEEKAREEEEKAREEEEEAREEEEEKARIRTSVKNGGCEGQERFTPTGLLAQLLEISGNRCGHCGVEFKENEIPEISHILPHALGGEASITNCVPAHKPCNGAHDSCEQLLDIDETYYWLRRNPFYIGKPLKLSIDQISSMNIIANWKRAQDVLNIPDTARSKTNNMRIWLEANGFEKFEL